MSEYPENELEQAAFDRASARTAGERLNNLTEAMVEDILKAPAEEILLEELSSRFEKLRAEVSRLSAALATAESTQNNAAKMIAALKDTVARGDAAVAQAERERDQARANALEEAAKVFDARAIAAENAPPGEMTGRTFHGIAAAKERTTAAQIRALSNPE